ncbi:MAG: pilus assembly protein [Acidimicrobiales bacterium]|nr:pilus assembly protein [Acidimicrobiales bacterium]
MRRTDRRRHGRSRGAVAVEMAIGLTLLASLVFGVIEMGRGLRSSQDLTEAARAGARTVAALPRVDDYEIAAADAVAAALLDDGTDIEPQLLTIYRADDTTGDPTNGTYTSCSNCWRFEWDDVNEEWDSLGSATWDAADMEACGDEVHTDYVGVWVQGRHEFVTTIVTFDMDIDARVTMRLEPLIGSSSCR